MNNATARPMIEAKSLTRYFGEFMAIKGITFSIPQGQIVAFLGPNGAGKTTTMRILTGFLRPSEGSASIAGLDITRDRLEAVRRLGYLPENGPLYDNMTPLELLRFFGEARGLRNNTLQHRIDSIVEQCALDNILEKPIGKLSRGYRQRVGLAQALLHDPEVLIMDEPTAGLDPNQIREFRANITNLANSKTILLSTHILQEVEAVAGRVLLVHNGQLVFDGSPDELRKGDSMEESFYKMTEYDNASSLRAQGGPAV
jgi:ABC-2 type transport system ATP-binding protein